jgi:hypothetical protein
MDLKPYHSNPDRAFKSPVAKFRTLPIQHRSSRSAVLGRSLLAALLLPLAFFCFVPLNPADSENPFRLVRVGGAGDTIAPFGSLALRFTRPVAHPDSIHFVFAPQFADYQLTFATTLDTITIFFAVPLQGSTRYSFHPDRPIEAADGHLLDPADDSVVVFTFPIEQEPNDSRQTADLLEGKLFGSISLASDTDWFAMPDTAARTFYLKSNVSSSQFDIRDATGALFRPTAFAMAETLAVPSSFVPPFCLVVYAWNRSNGGFYEAGTVRRPEIDNH